MTNQIHNSTLNGIQMTVSCRENVTLLTCNS